MHTGTISSRLFDLHAINMKSSPFTRDRLRLINGADKAGTPDRFSLDSKPGDADRSRNESRRQGTQEVCDRESST